MHNKRGKTKCVREKSLHSHTHTHRPKRVGSGNVQGLFAIECKCSITKCVLFSLVLLLSCSRCVTFFYVPLLLLLLLLLLFSFGRPPPKQPSIADTKRIHLNKPFIWLLLNNLILFPSFLGSFFLVFLSDTVMHFHLHSQFAFIVCAAMCLYPIFLYSTYSMHVQWLKRRRKKLHCIGIHKMMHKKRDAFIHLSFSLPLSLDIGVFVRYT